MRLPADRRLVSAEGAHVLVFEAIVVFVAWNRDICYVALVVFGARANRAKVREARRLVRRVLYESEVFVSYRKEGKKAARRRWLVGELRT
jgi:hypothetical protein